MDEEAMKVGLLLKTAKTHLKLVEALLDKLKEHSLILDAVARAAAAPRVHRRA
ncbi:MAG: hypothetical protein JO139_14120 [Alphaproteobacteria bacterium]|nr:hypothetical protein [Alphaproteobacteria bacterium]